MIGIFHKKILKKSIAMSLPMDSALSIAKPINELFIDVLKRKQGQSTKILVK